MTGRRTWRRPLVYERTGSPLLSSLTFAVAFLPYVFGGTLLGALVDRLPRKAQLIGFDLVGAGLIALTAIAGVPIVALFAEHGARRVRSG